VNKLFFVAIFLLLSTTESFTQNYEPSEFLKVIPLIDQTTPDWAKKMYANEPNVNEVDKLYHLYFKKNAFKKSIHTQNYKHWRWRVEPFIDDNGFIKIPQRSAEDARNAILKNKYIQRQNAAESSAPWYAMGPFETFKQNTTQPKANHKNVYSIDQSASNSDVLICGTEAGGVYKSTDKGLNWSLITKGEAFVGGNTAVKIHPTNSNTYLVSSNSRIYRTTDGGVNWTEVHYMNGSAYEFKYDPSNSNNVFAVGSKGLFKSTDGGATWTNPITVTCYDLDFHPTNASIVYLLQKNSVAKRSELFRSDDGGANWTLKDNGYFTPSDLANASVSGGKIGVTPASADLVYVCLIGTDKAGDNGWIGVYKSTDKGDNWTNPSGQDGGPYSTINGAAMWNVAAYSSAGTQQGFYNFDMEVSHNDANRLWIGTVRLTESTDGGATFTSIGGSNTQRLDEVHADIQDIEVIGNDVWVANDGGIHYSNDELQTHSIRTKGIQASHFWGFNIGWNEDVFIGGKYHTGTSVYYEGYGLGQAQHVGGVEEASGYIHPINSRKVYYRTNYASSNTSVKTVSSTLGATTLSHASLPLRPNEHYFSSRSNAVTFDPRYADHLFIGLDNKMYKSKNGGASFDVLHTFPAGKVYEFKISRKNPSVMYAVFQPDNGDTYWNSCELHKSIDGGTTWSAVTNPPSSTLRRIEITINPDDENEIWVATNGNNTNGKVFQSEDGGTTWTNRMTIAINDEDIRDITFQGGTTDLVYIATGNTVFYWNGSDWIEYATGLPAIAKSLKIEPFYRDAELRLGSSGRGAFGREMANVDFAPLAQPITYRDSSYCAKDVVDLDCRSILKHAGASWLWSISPAPTYISSTTVRNPKVIFGASGNYDITLTVTDGNGASHSKTITEMIKIDDRCATEAVSGKALNTASNGDYALISGLNTTNITEFTISAWIKPNGGQSGFAGIVTNGAWDAASSSTIGLIFDYHGNKLWYKWGGHGGSWGSNSGMTIPLDEWSYVAITVKSDSIVLYLNDDRHVTVASVGAVDVNDWYIGKGFYNNPYFKGKIDEVTLWNRALSKEEIRKFRHLTKTEAMMASDANLIGYFQFNNRYSDVVLNKLGGVHASLTGNATLATSGAPVGGGVSQHKILNGAGDYDFTNVGAKLKFSDCTTIDGDMYITKINDQPYLPANANTHSGGYWLINHYDNTEALSPLENIELTATDGSFVSGLSNINDAYLHLRSLNSDVFDWTTKSTAQSNDGNKLTFLKSNGIDGATQIFVTNSGTSFTETDAVSYCEPDTLPMKSMYLLGSSSTHAIIPPLNLNTNKMTISAWIKPEGIQNSGAGIVFTRAGTSVSGLNFKSNNELGYHWNGNEYGWYSGATVPADVWSHVVLMIEPNQATIYLNGVPYIRTGRNHALEAFDGVTLIGKDNSSYTRRFKGEIDEVCIWNRALRIGEIRRHRHLTKEKMIGNMPSLKAYYQFNEADGTTVYDKSGNKNHATLNGSATRNTSTAPIGSGKSQRIVIGGNGQHNTDSSGVQVTFPAAGTHPKGVMIISRINSVQTASLPANQQNIGCYWIVNNYGTNQAFSAIQSLNLKPSAFPNSGFNTASNIHFYKREDNEHRSDQWTQMCNPTSLAGGSFTFDNSCNMTSFSQLHIIEMSPLPVELLRFEVFKTENAQTQLKWSTATQENFSHFELEHSINGVDFTTFKTVETDFPNSLQTLNYEAIHENPILGYNFYRLKMVDLDGAIEYSDIKAILMEKAEKNIEPKLFPNPVQSGESFTLNIQNLTNPRLIIYKANGKIAKDFLLKDGDNQISTSRLSAGTYFYSIQSEHKIYNGRIVVL